MRKAMVKLLMAAALFIPLPAWAGEKLTANDILKGTELNGFLSAGYNYNFNTPGDRAIDLRPFNDTHDSFALELAQLIFHREAEEPGSAGFRLDLNFGYTVPAAIHSTGAASSDDFDLRQAYISYMAPVGTGLKLDFGKFVTDHGAEVIEGYEGWNWNYSRSFLFYLGIPFTHTGLRATYAVNDRITLSGAVVNGWDNVKDNNTGKSLHLHAAISLAEETAVNVKYMAGPEQDNNTGNWRHLLNLNLSTTLGKALVMADLVYGQEEDVPGIGDSTWSGIAGYVRYPLSEKFYLNARVEVFSDDDGARTAADDGSGGLIVTPQTLWEFTVTPEYIVNENLVVRAEYRHDSSDKEVFDNGTAKRQDTVGVNAIFHF